MSDWGTMIQSLKEDSHSLASSDLIKRKVIDAIRFHRERNFWWSERTFAFQLTPNRSRYLPGDGSGLPSDLQQIASKMLRLRLNLTVSGADFFVYRATEGELDLAKTADAPVGDPIVWGFWEGALEFWPIPTSAWYCEGRYLRNIEVPVTRYSSGTYSFHLPSTGAEVPDSWDSDWVSQDGMGSLIRARALHLICNYLGDTEGANAAMTTWLELSNQADDETTVRTAGTASSIMPRMF